MLVLRANDDVSFGGRAELADFRSHLLYFSWRLFKNTDINFPISAMIYRSLSCDELVRACVDSGNAEAWQEFVRRFEPLISLVLLRIARRYGEYDPALIEDLVQDTFGKFCANDCRVLRNFKALHENAFYGMAKKTAANVGHDHFRKRHALRSGSGKSDVELSEVEAFIPDPRASTSDHLDHGILLQEIDGILHVSCSERDREIFWLYHRETLTAAEIAGINRFELGEKGVESVLHRLKSLIREKLVATEKV